MGICNPEADRWVSEFNAKGLANTAWAFAMVHQLDEKLLTESAREAERWVSESNVQELERSEGQAAASVHLRECTTVVALLDHR